MYFIFAAYVYATHYLWTSMYIYIYMYRCTSLQVLFQMHRDASTEKTRDTADASVVPTVDGRNPAPPGMYKTLSIIGYIPYQLVRRISFINSINWWICEHCTIQNSKTAWSLTRGPKSKEFISLSLVTGVPCWGVNPGYLGKAVEGFPPWNWHSTWNNGIGGEGLMTGAMSVYSCWWFSSHRLVEVG